MYSFEGDFRRKPQQNLSGASGIVKADRESLIQYTQQQRQKREEVRRRLFSTLKIQAYVRSFLTRVREKRKQRKEFDLLFDQHKSDDLVLLMQKILFLFDKNTDVSRLISLSQEVLRHRSSIVKDLKSIVLLRRILGLHLNIFDASHQKQDVSLAIPLRMMEVFTSIDLASQILNQNEAIIATCRTLLYLIQKGYFSKLKRLLDSVCPPLLGNTARAPTPMCGAIFELIQHPLSLVDVVNNHEYSKAICQSFASSILCEEYTEAVQKYLLVAIQNDVQRPFPFHHFVNNLTLDERLNTSWMLHSVLILESKQFVEESEKNESLTCAYLNILSKLTENISRKSANILATWNSNCNESSDSEADVDIADQSFIEKYIISVSIDKLNGMDSFFMRLCSRTIERSYSDIELKYMCNICHHLLLSHKQAVHRNRCLQRLAFRVQWLKSVWIWLNSIQLEGSKVTLIGCLSVAASAMDYTNLNAPLSVFCALYTLLLDTLHDDEIASADCQTSICISDLRAVSLTVRDIAVGLSVLLHPDTRSNFTPNYNTMEWEHLFTWCVQLLQTLHTRDSRLHFLGHEGWTSGSASLASPSLPHGFSSAKGGPPLTAKEMRIFTILKEIPFVIPFPTRVHILQSLILQDKNENQSEITNFLQGPTINIVVRRTHLYEDAFDKLRPENEPNLRHKLRVQLINQVGADEAGVDGGGLFREFIAELLKSAFDPNRGLFCLTKDNMLYPNPAVHMLYEDFPNHYYFIGRMLGKALYESVLVEVPLAWFFLARLLGRARADLHELASLDPALRRGLLQLRAHPPHLVPDLGLDFTLLIDHLGEQKIVELKVNGSNMPVTAENRIEYIHLVADYKIYKQIRMQCRAFVSGVTSVMPKEWLQMFSPKELQLLISGGDQPIDISDLKRHTSYSGGYGEEHPTIVNFWNALQNFTNEQKRQLLKFVTSCSRPPLLGFKDLQPPFCIQNAGSAQRLPSASTCMNLLKLPDIQNEDLLAEKLLYAIQSGAGFELS